MSGSYALKPANPSLVPRPYKNKRFSYKQPGYEATPILAISDGTRTQSESALEQSISMSPETGRQSLHTAGTCELSFFFPNTVHAGMRTAATATVAVPVDMGCYGLHLYTIAGARGRNL